jgi:hypothetical protein
MEREYIRDRTLEGHEPARKRGKAIGGASVTNDDAACKAPSRCPRTSLVCRSSPISKKSRPSVMFEV